jgi:hypothetical protein
MRPIRPRNPPLSPIPPRNLSLAPDEGAGKVVDNEVNGASAGRLASAVAVEDAAVVEEGFNSTPNCGRPCATKPNCISTTSCGTTAACWKCSTPITPS